MTIQGSDYVLIGIVAGQFFGLIATIAGNLFQSKQTRLYREWDLQDRAEKKRQEEAARLAQRTIDEAVQKQLHAEQLLATSLAAQASVNADNSAQAAFKESNAVNQKIAALQQTANAALGVPDLPYVAPKYEPKTDSPKRP